jgi:glycosyltransferase involved in cell wall biosynthesis
LRIGVDARSLSEPITGIGRYTLNLLQEMVVNDSHEWVLYSHRPLQHGDWDKVNVKVRTWSLPKWARILRMLWAQSALPLMAKKDEVDLFWSPAHRLPRYLPNSIASVVTIHDLVWKHAPETMRPFSQKLDAKFMPEAIRMADKVIAVSKWTANDLITEVPEAEVKTSVIYEANSLKLSDLIDFDKVDGEYILFVGTLEPRKNLPRLLQAYALLSKTIRDKHPLVIVGGKGWGKDNIYSIIEQLSISKHVKVLGYLSDEELASVYHQSHLFVMPSLYEGFGLPLLEAMSMGVPVVTSNISSLPEIVGDNAVIVDPNNVESIKDGIEKVLIDNELRNQLSKAGLDRAKLFSWKGAAKETLAVFEEALFFVNAGLNR